MSEDYNGWTNYETWNVKLWLDNDEATFDDVHEAIRSLLDYPGWNIDDAAYRAGQRIEAYVRELPEVDVILSSASMAADLLGAALDNVNWGEIGEGYLNDMAA